MPLRFLEDSSAQGHRDRGKQNPSLHYPESRREPGTMPERTREGGGRHALDASAQYDLSKPQHSRADFAVPWGATRWEPVWRSRGLPTAGIQHHL